MYWEEKRIRSVTLLLAWLTVLAILLAMTLPVSGAVADVYEELPAGEGETDREYGLRLMLQNLLEGIGIGLIVLSVGVTAAAFIGRKPYS